MANIMYDYNKTRLMYGLRKLAEEGKDKQQPLTPAPTPAPALSPAPAPTPAEKPGPNYNFTLLQRAAARKRRALITAVAGTVGFGTGYLANLLISDDPTLTGGLLTGGVVGALAGGAGYALSDPLTYLKNEADNEFKKNNPGGGKDEEKAEDPSWGDRVDDLADWIVEHPWATAIGGGLGIPAILGTARKLRRQGLDAITDSLQKVKNLFSRNNDGAAQKPISKQKAAVADADDVEKAVKWLNSSNSKNKTRGALLYDRLTPAQKALVDKRLGRQPAAPAGNTPGNNGANQGKPGAAPAPAPAPAPAGNTPGNNGANQGKPGAATGNTPGNNGANQGKPGNQSGYLRQVHTDSANRVPLDKRIAQLGATGMPVQDMAPILRAEGYTQALLNDYTYRTIISNNTPGQAKDIIKGLLVKNGVNQKTADAQAQAIVNAYSTRTSQATGNSRGGNKGGTTRGGNKGGTPRGRNKGGTPRGNRGGRTYGRGGTRGTGGGGVPRITQDSVKGM